MWPDIPSAISSCCLLSNDVKVPCMPLENASESSRDCGSQQICRLLSELWTCGDNRVVLI